MKLDINNSSVIMGGVGTIVGMTIMIFTCMNTKIIKIENMHQIIQNQQIEITKLQEQKTSDLRLLRELRRQISIKRR